MQPFLVGVNLFFFTLDLAVLFAQKPVVKNPGAAYDDVCYGVFDVSFSVLLCCVIVLFVLFIQALQNNMAHPEYAWMFFNWYNDNWWTNISCTKNDPDKERAIENILLTSLIYDHYPRIDEEYRNESNVGNIVSYSCI